MQRRVGRSDVDDMQLDCAWVRVLCMSLEVFKGIQKGEVAMG